MKDNKDLVKVSTYAKEKGVSTQAIYKQIAEKKLDFVVIDGVKFIKRK